LKFGDIVTAVASSAVILALLIFPIDMVLVPALGFFWGLNVGAIVSVLLTALIVGYVFAGKIWESRMEAIAKITALSAVLMAFFVAITLAATEWPAVVREANPGATYTALEWHIVEHVALLGQIFLNVIIVIVLGFIGLYIGSMFRRPVESKE